jgi:hypothetical protein
MRALTVEELGFVSGGTEPPVIVTGRRVRRSSGYIDNVMFGPTPEVTYVPVGGDIFSDMYNDLKGLATLDNFAESLKLDTPDEDKLTIVDDNGDITTFLFNKGPNGNKTYVLKDFGGDGWDRMIRYTSNIGSSTTEHFSGGRFRPGPYPGG